MDTFLTSLTKLDNFPFFCQLLFCLKIITRLTVNLEISDWAENIADCEICYSKLALMRTQKWEKSPFFIVQVAAPELLGLPCPSFAERQPSKSAMFSAQSEIYRLTVSRVKICCSPITITPLLLGGNRWFSRNLVRQSLQI